MYRGFPIPSPGGGGLPPRGGGGLPPRGPPPAASGHQTQPPARAAQPYYGGPYGPGPPQRPNMPPLGHLNQQQPRPCAPVLQPGGPDSNYLHNRHNTQPHCSSFSIGHNTGMAMGSQQIPQWNHTGPLEQHQKDNSERAGEEFLRCLATNQPFPDYLKGNMSYNLAEALKSANALKAAVSTDPEFQKNIIKSKSRSRSRGRSRGRSRAKSRVRSRSRGRSKGRSTSRSRAKSRARSKSRAPSRSRGKSRARSKSRGRSRSPTSKQERSKSRVRAKSRARSRSRSRSHEKHGAKEHRNGNHQSHSAYSSGSNVSNSNASIGNESLLQGLQRVMNSKDLEMGLPALKDAIRTIKATNLKDIKVESASGSECLNNTSSMESESMLQSECLNNTLMNARPMESDSMLLPHERVGIDFSWLQASNQDVPAAVQKEEDLDDEEFLYGREDGSKRSHTPTAAPYAPVSQSLQHSAAPRSQVECSPAPSQMYALSGPMFNNLGDLLDVKQLGGSASPSQNATKADHRLKQELPPPSGSNDKEYEKIQGLLKNFGLNMGIADIGTMMTKIQDQKKEVLTLPPQPTGGSGTAPAGLGFATAAMGHTGVRHALESLQCLIKATKEKRVKGDPHGRSDSPKTIVKKKDPAEEGREKQARMKKIESMLKDMEGLLKDNGTDFMIPVIGFYCQKCEEFIGDLKTAESHASSHSHKDSSIAKQHTDKKMVEDKGHSLPHSSSSSSGSRQPHHSDRKDQRDSSYHRDTVDHRDRRDYHGKQRDERDHRASDLKHKHDSDSRGHKHEQEKIAVREGMMKERLLITVSRGQSPPRSGINEELLKVQPSGKHGRNKQEESSAKESNTQDSDDSSDSSDDEKGKSSGKSPKKKKKKKEKKKDKKKKKDSHKDSHRKN